MIGPIQLKTFAVNHAELQADISLIIVLNKSIHFAGYDVAGWVCSPATSAMSSIKKLHSAQNNTASDLNESFSDLSDFADLSGSLSWSLKTTSSFGASLGTGHFGSVADTPRDISQPPPVAQDLLKSGSALTNCTPFGEEARPFSHSSGLLSGYFGNKSCVDTGRFLSAGQALSFSLPLSWSLPSPSLNRLSIPSLHPNVVNMSQLWPLGAPVAKTLPLATADKTSQVTPLVTSTGKTSPPSSGHVADSVPRSYRRSSNPDVGTKSLDSEAVRRVEDIVSVIAKMTSSGPVTSPYSMLSSVQPVKTPKTVTSSNNMTPTVSVTSSKSIAISDKLEVGPATSSAVVTAVGYKLSKSQSVDSMMDLRIEIEKPNLGDNLQKKLSSTFKKHYLKTVVVTDSNTKVSSNQKETAKHPSLRIEHQEAFETKLVHPRDYAQGDNTSQSVAVKDGNSNDKRTIVGHANKNASDCSLSPGQKSNGGTKSQKSASNKPSTSVVRKISKFMSLLGTFKDLQHQHEHALSDITKRFENIKMTLSEKVDHLRAESEAMRRREREYLASYKADSDMKVQLAVQPFKHLPQEIESLKAVLEMRNQEIHELRRKNLEFEKQLEELPKAREKITHLEQKNENLEAVIKLKVDYERQLSEKHSVLLRRYDKEAKANKRLSMDKEELEWRLSQDSTGLAELLNRSISHSPPSSTASTPEATRRRKSPLPQQSPRSPRGGIAMEFFDNKSPRMSRSMLESPRSNGTNAHHRKQVKSADFDRPIFSTRHSSADLYTTRRDPNNVFEAEHSQDDSLMSVSTHSEPSKSNPSPVKTNLKRSGTYDLLNEEFELCEEGTCSNNLKQTDV